MISEREAVSILKLIAIGVPALVAPIVMRYRMKTGKNVSKNTKLCPFCGKEILDTSKECEYCKKNISKDIKLCPFCGEEILAEAEKCKYCGKNIDHNATALKQCPFCGEGILVTAEQCRYCKKWVKDQGEVVLIHTDLPSADPVMDTPVTNRQEQSNNNQVEENTKDEIKKCPFCGEEVLAAAKKCKHCKEWLEN